MIGMVLVSHGRVAAEMVRALEHIVGPQANVAAICIEPDDDMDKGAPTSWRRSPPPTTATGSSC